MINLQDIHFIQQASKDLPPRTKLNEAPTRKDFRMVANTVRSIEDPKKRQEFADHHANIYAAQNPRFSHSKWHAACGTKMVKEQNDDNDATSSTSELSEKNWIAGAIKHPGAEKRAAKKAGLSTHAYMEREKDAPGKAGKRARLGLELSKFHKEEKEETMNEDIQNMVVAAIEDKPDDFSQSFDAVMQEKIGAMVANYKQLIQNQLLGVEEVDDEEDETETVEFENEEEMMEAVDEAVEQYLEENPEATEDEAIDAVLENLEIEEAVTKTDSKKKELSKKISYQDKIKRELKMRKNYGQETFNMTKSLLQILTKPLGYKKAGNPLKWPMKPHPRETDVRDFLSTLEITAQDEPAGNDDAFSAKDVKVYDRKAHRYGHDNIDFNDLPPKSKFFTMEESEEEPIHYEGLSDSEPLSTGQVTTKAKKPLRKIVKEGKSPYKQGKKDQKRFSKGKEFKYYSKYKGKFNTDKDAQEYNKGYNRGYGVKEEETLDEIKRSPHDLLQKQIYHDTSAREARSIARYFRRIGVSTAAEGYNRWTRKANNHDKARLAAAKLERQEKTKLGIKD